MTPILRPNAPRLQLPRIDEEPIQDDENVSSEMFQTRNRTSFTAQASHQIRLPPNAECNTENSFCDDF